MRCDITLGAINAQRGDLSPIYVQRRNLGPICAQLRYCPAEQSPRGDSKTGNIGDSIHQIFSQYGNGSSTFSAILSFLRIKELCLMVRNSK